MLNGTPLSKHKYAIAMNLDSINSSISNNEKLDFTLKMVELGFEQKYNGVFISNTDKSNDPVFCVLELQNLVLMFTWLKNVEMDLMRIESIDSLKSAFDLL